MTVADNSLLLKSSAAQTASTTGAAVDFGGADLVDLVYRVSVTAVTGTGMTLDLTIKDSPTDGTYTTLVAFPQITAFGEYFATARSGDRYRKYVSVIAGTTPSFTYTIAVVPAGRYNNF